jgi:hypothetical protein
MHRRRLQRFRAPTYGVSAGFEAPWSGHRKDRVDLLGIAGRRQTLCSLRDLLEVEHGELASQLDSDAKRMMDAMKSVVDNAIFDARWSGAGADCRYDVVYTGYLAAGVCQMRRAVLSCCEAHRWTRNGSMEEIGDGGGYDICRECSGLCGCTVEEGFAYVEAKRALGTLEEGPAEALKQLIVEGICCELS